MRCRQNWIAFNTLFRRETARIIRIWPQTLMPQLITMILYFIIFGDVIGERIGDMNGVPYMEYIVPGLIMMAIINSSYMNTVSTFFFAKFQRNIEEMLVSPMPNIIIILGHVSGGVFRGLLVGFLIALVSLLFADLKIYSYILTFSIAILTATLFSLAGLINGIFAKKFDDISIVPMFILTPLSYLGGVFYSVTLLPPFWQSISRFNPILYMVNGFRYGIIGNADVMVEQSILFILILDIALLMFSVWLMRKGVGIKS